MDEILATDPNQREKALVDDKSVSWMKFLPQPQIKEKKLLWMINWFSWMKHFSTAQSNRKKSTLG
jgi:hypothetical protein